jgi:hypothetical protein
VPASSRAAADASLIAIAVEPDIITGWCRYRVLHHHDHEITDLAVGFVAEWHDWYGYKYGPPR